MRRRLNKVFSFFILVFLTFSSIFLIWAYTPLKASTDAKKYLNADDIKVTIERNGDTVLEPIEKMKSGKDFVGVVFYPGGHVEHLAYLPLGYLLAKKGITTVILKVPLNLAFLRINGARKYIEDFGNLRWYVAGHSLGGVAASEYAYKNQKDVAGLILLASYPARDMSNMKIPVLSIFGSNDGRFEQIQEKKVLLNKNTVYYLIKGGNHSQFGDYGFQKGDGKASISRQEQLDETIKAIYEFIFSKD
ncbi:MAG: alpha/beta hydrolase [Fervidobacterium sp.]|jgi:hypothetical protein